MGKRFKCNKNISFKIKIISLKKKYFTCGNLCDIEGLMRVKCNFPENKNDILKKDESMGSRFLFVTF